MKTGERGVTMMEALIALAILSLTMTVLGTLFDQTIRINRAQRVQSELQESARTAMSVVVQQLRTAGWNPRQVSGITTVTPTPTGSTSVDQIQIQADLNGDGSVTPVDTDLDGTISSAERVAVQDEIVNIRWSGREVQWQHPNVSTNWETVAGDITNDANGDGTAESMFTLSSASNPKTVTVTITAQSPLPDVQTRAFRRYTTNSVAMLRGAP